MSRYAFLAGLVLVLGSGTAPAEGPPTVFDGLFPEGRRTQPLGELIGRVQLAPGESFRLVEIGRDTHSSHHLVWIRDREQPHRHDRHDLFVVILRGFGSMQLGKEERPVGEGSILFVPRGTPHAFRNDSDRPAIAYAVYAPAFDGLDRVPLDAPPTREQRPR
ncbi:MAG: cupin domain-containing protein [Myxococcota bacterium]